MPNTEKNWNLSLAFASSEAKGWQKNLHKSAIVYMVVNALCRKTHFIFLEVENLDVFLVEQ